MGVYTQALTKQASDQSSGDFLKQFHERLRGMPDSHLIAKEVDRLFCYINRYYVQNNSAAPVREKVLEGWALMDWDSIVDCILEPCNRIVKANPTLVVNIAKQFARLLPRSAHFAVCKVTALER